MNILKIIIVIIISLLGIVSVGVAIFNLIEELEDGDILCSIGATILTLVIGMGFFAIVFAIITYI